MARSVLARERKSLLVVYADDFKLAAKAELPDKLWVEIWRAIDMDLESLDGLSLITI